MYFTSLQWRYLLVHVCIFGHDYTLVVMSNEHVGMVCAVLGSTTKCDFSLACCIMLFVLMMENENKCN